MWPSNSECLGNLEVGSWSSLEVRVCGEDGVISPKKVFVKLWCWSEKMNEDIERWWWWQARSDTLLEAIEGTNAIYKSRWLGLHLGIQPCERVSKPDNDQYGMPPGLPYERPPKPPTFWNSYTRTLIPDTDDTLRNDRDDTKKRWLLIHMFAWFFFNVHTLIHQEWWGTHKKRWPFQTRPFANIMGLLRCSYVGIILGFWGKLACIHPWLAAPCRCRDPKCLNALAEGVASLADLWIKRYKGLC